MNNILRKCEGNPLCSLQFMISLIENDFVTIKEGTMFPQQKFMACVKMDDWCPLSVPNLMMRVNGEQVDKLLRLGMTKGISKKDSYNYTKAIIILKAAAVIGENFTFA